MVTNAKNAHIRKQSSKRQSPEVQTDEAQRLLDDPAFQRGFSAVREGMIQEIINLKHDGSAATNDFEAECCRVLRTLHSVRRGISIGIQRQSLRLADLQPKVAPEEKENAT